MSLRRLPPVHSPLSAAALLAGWNASQTAAAAGRARAEVERWIATRFSPDALLLTDSGTSALTAALTLAMPAGGRVALPAWGCYDLATACDGAGVEVLLYDLDPATLAPDWSSLRTALRGGASAVVTVHFYGLPVPVAEVTALAREHDAVVIEDAAQGAGASVGGRPCGALGPGLGVLSFGRGKGVTGGRGGALLGFDATFRNLIAEQSARLGDPPSGRGELPKSLVQMLLARPSLYVIPSALPFLKLGETLYHPPHPVAPLSRSAAGLLAVTMQLADSESERRRRHAARLAAVVETVPGLQAVTPLAGSIPGYLRLPVRGAVMGPRLVHDPIARGLGIMPGYPGTLADLPGFAARIRNSGVSLPGARELAARLGTMPTHGLLDDRDLARLQDWLVAARAT